MPKDNPYKDLILEFAEKWLRRDRNLTDEQAHEFVLTMWGDFLRKASALNDKEEFNGSH